MSRGAALVLTLAALSIGPVRLPAQDSQSPLPTEPPRRVVDLYYQGRFYTVHGDSRDERLLRSVYGPDWQQSLPYRSALRLRADQPAGALLDELQRTHGGTDIVYTFPYRDEPHLIHPGEHINLFGRNPDTGRMRWYFLEIREGDSLERLARRYGITVADITSVNPDRFDVWPNARENPSSTGFVTIPDRWNSRLASDESLDGLLVHEGAHTTDRVAGNLRPDDYGTVKDHDFGEITTRRAAWMEGWAEYNQGLVDPGTRARIGTAARYLFRDPASGLASDPVEHVATPTHADYLASEATVADMLLQLDGHGANRARIHALMTTMNAELTSVANPREATTEEKVGIDLFLGRYVRRHPGDADDVLLVYDVTTGFTAEPAHLLGNFGPAAEAHLTRRERLRSLWEEYRTTAPDPTAGAFIGNLRADPRATTTGPLDPMVLLDAELAD